MDAMSAYLCPDVLAGDDLDPVLILNPASTRAVLLIADHAGNAVPAAMNGLGIEEEDLLRHIAWDPGAAIVATELSRRWLAAAVLSRYSRLIVDPNRPLGDASSMPHVSDNTVVPANQDITEEDRRRRAALFYWPYHLAISEQIARLRRIGPGPLLVSIHSFTPDFGGEDRPWHIGVMSTADRRLADVLISGLSKATNLIIGDNQPYSGVEYGYTLKVQAGSQGLASVQIEIRQDLLADDGAVLGLVDVLDHSLSLFFDNPALLELKFH